MSTSQEADALYIFVVKIFLNLYHFFINSHCFIFSDLFLNGIKLIKKISAVYEFK